MLTTILSLAFFCWSFASAGSRNENLRSRRSRSSSSSSSEDDSLLPFWGVTNVWQHGKEVKKKAYGLTSYFHDTPMQTYAKFPIGSTSKLFTAVAIYQLQEQGLLNVDDDIALYLDANDFKLFGLDNITTYCPVLLNDTTNTCQTITFSNLMSMTSGIVRAINCGYQGYFAQYCWNICDSTELYLYSGSIAAYVGTFINVPLTLEPDTIYDYANTNYILLSYFIEKLSGMSLEDYYQQNIFDVAGLRDTYYDPWNNVFGGSEMKNRVNTWYLLLDLDDPTIDLGVGWCQPNTAPGVANGAGGIISTTNDLIKFYQDLFNPNNPIPSVFTTANSRNALVEPVVLINQSWADPNAYMGHGVELIYNFTISTTWPLVVSFEGSTFCANVAIKMIPDDTLTIVAAFSNAPRMYIPNGEDGLENIRTNIEMNQCNMWFNGEFFIDDGGALERTEQLLDEYSM